MILFLPAVINASAYGFVTVKHVPSQVAQWVLPKPGLVSGGFRGDLSRAKALWAVLLAGCC